jgi:L-fucose isomerase-like protein
VGAVRGAVYGQFGPRPANFETCAFDELSLLRKLGVRVVPIPMSTLFARAEYAPEKKVRETYADMASGVDHSEVPDLDLARMARLEVVLEEMIEEHGLDGFGLQCWTSMQKDYGVSPCFVMARLTGRGVPGACEVDIHGTLSMHLLSAVAGGPAGLADWNNRHVERTDVFSAWHCGVFPPSFAGSGCRLGYHNIIAEDTGGPEGKYGTLELSVAKGPVTMARVTEHPWDEWPFLVVEGDVVDAEGEPFGSNAWVEVSDLDSLYSAILRGFPHHAAITTGKHAPALLTASYFLGLDPVVPLEVTEGALVTGPEY